MEAGLTARLSSLVHTCTRWHGQRWRNLQSSHAGHAGHGAGLRRARLGAVCLMALLGWLTPVFATTYYVDPGTGENTNSGTSPGSPWQNPPGTRTTSDSGFISATWGAIATTNKIQCGDTILLKGGATQTQHQGGAWRIDNGPNQDGTGYYTTGCPQEAPITIRVATPAEWGDNTAQGNFTLDGTGATVTCVRFCGDTYGLVHVQDIDTLIFGGTSASQRLVIQHAAGVNVNNAHNLLVTSSTASPPFLMRFQGQWLELAAAQNDGVGVGAAQQFVIRNTIAHDNGGSGFSTGFVFDHRIINGAFQDVEAFQNGAGNGAEDQFFFTGCESCYLIRAQSHDGSLRGLNFGNLGTFGGTDMFLLIRDSAFWHNGLTPDTQAVYQSGPCWSGDDAPGGQLHFGVIERSIIALNREAGGPCAYGQGWADVWNSVWWHNGYDKTVGGVGDIAVANQVDLHFLGVFNSIVQKRSDNVTWTATAPSGYGAKQCPVADYNLFCPVAADTETLSDFECVGTQDFSFAARTYANPPAFLGPHTLLGSSYHIDFVHTDDTVYSNNDFHLQGTSSAIDAGTFMFRASGSGTGTQIYVLGNGGSNDPRHYFLSPESYYTAAGDTIQIEGCGQVTITSMDAVSISFTPSCTWTDGAGIHFPWHGTRPDMGVYEFLGPSVARGSRRCCRS